MPALFDSPSNCLAPMVRVGTAPMRLLALEYGADVVYSEELVAQSLAATTRHEAVELPGGAVVTDWVRPGTKGASRMVLRVAERERSRLVVQLGAAEPVAALAAASLVQGHVAAVDLNMGCPVHFSVSGGMGAELLKKPETAADILSTLRRNLSVPVTAKIRLLSSTAETLELAKRLEACGIAALAVHCREPHHRSSRQPALWDELPALVAALSIPVIANGDVFQHSDFERVRERTGCHSVMAARGAMWNPSIFRRPGPEGGGEADLVGEVMPRYMALSHEMVNHPLNTKSVLLDMLERKGAPAGGGGDCAATGGSGGTGGAGEEGGASLAPYERVDDGEVAVDEGAVVALIGAREAHRARKEWAEADALQMALRCKWSVRLNDQQRYWAAVHPDGRCGKKKSHTGVKSLRNQINRAKTLQQLEAAVVAADAARQQPPPQQPRQADSSGAVVAKPPDEASLRKIEAAMAAAALAREAAAEG